MTIVICVWGKVIEEGGGSVFFGDGFVGSGDGARQNWFFH